MELFVVQVTHTAGGHGPVTQPILVTIHAVAALTAAHRAQGMGYQLVNDGDGAQVFCLEVGKIARSEAFADGAGFSSPMTLVFYRIRHRNTEGGWLTAWLNPEIEKVYRRVFETVIT